MLNEAQLKQVWEEWLSAEMRANYFADLAGVYSRRHRGATWATLLLSSGAAVAFVGQWLSKEPLAALALMVAAVSLYSLVAQNPKTSADCADLHFRWSRIAMDYQALWQGWYADDAAAQLARINERSAEASRSSAVFPYDEKRLSKWEDLVVSHRASAAAA